MRLLAEVALLVLAAVVVLAALFFEHARWSSIKRLLDRVEETVHEFLRDQAARASSNAAKSDETSPPELTSARMLSQLRAEAATALRISREAMWAFLIAGVLVALSGTLALVGPLVRAAPQSLAVGLRWWVNERTGDVNGNGVSDWEDPTEVNPPYWRVFFAATGWDCPHSRAVLWEIDGAPGPTQVCRFHHDFPSLGSHQVKLSAVSATGAVGSYNGDVAFQDWLIVSIGDSVASGEGNPPWTDKSCHRSNAAGPVQAAMQLAAHDDHTTVTLLHLACSGATILRGLLRPQFSGVAAQIGQVGQLILSRRRIDAILVSIGANDIGFAKIATACAVHRHCDTRKGVLEHVKSLEKLPHWYKRLNLCLTGNPAAGPCFTFTGGSPLEPLDIAPGRVFVTEYFDPTRDGQGKTCKRILLPWPLGINKYELQWTQNNVLGPLNQAVAAAAGMYGWHFVGGIADSFRTHGYCAKKSWIVHLAAALMKRDPSGPLHPNRVGHIDGYAPEILASLEAVLYPSEQATGDGDS